MGISAISLSGNVQPQAAPARTGTPVKQEFSKEEQAKIEQLKASDTKVRQHEQAHLSAAGGLATSGPTFTYQRGPNGLNYAVGGEVNINTSPGRTPQETVERARQIEAAALAPADPSSQDRSVAARARQMAQQAEAEISAKQLEVQRSYGQAPRQPTIDLFA